MNVAVSLSNRVADAREAMAALIASRSLGIREDDSRYPEAVAELSWAIADAMAAERQKRTGSQSAPPPDGRGGAR